MSFTVLQRSCSNTETAPTHTHQQKKIYGELWQELQKAGSKNWPLNVRRQALFVSSKTKTIQKNNKKKKRRKEESTSTQEENVENKGNKKRYNSTRCFFFNLWENVVVVKFECGAEFGRGFFIEEEKRSKESTRRRRARRRAASPWRLEQRETPSVRFAGLSGPAASFPFADLPVLLAVRLLAARPRQRQRSNPFIRTRFIPHIGRWTH